MYLGHDSRLRDSDMHVTLALIRSRLVHDREGQRFMIGGIAMDTHRADRLAYHGDPNAGPVVHLFGGPEPCGR